MQEILNILSSVGFNPHVALANFVNFLIILFILHTFFFKKIGKTINERERLIKQGLTKASEGEALLLRAEEEKSSLLKEAKKESHTLIEQANKKGEDLIRAMMQKGEAELAAKASLLDEKEKALSLSVEKEFLSRAPALLASLFEATMKKEMTEEKNNAFIATIK